MGDLNGKRVLVTGAASGIGFEIAAAFTEHGARVMLSDIADEPLAKAAAGLGALSVRCDVTKSSDVKDALDATVEALGGIDILVNNAGIEQVHPLLEHPDDEFEQIFAVNVRSVFYGIKHGAPAILRSARATGTGGAIVNMASVAGLGGPAFFGVYGATKAAVVSLTQTAAVELRDHGVRVNALCPAFIGTPMVERAIPVLSAAVESALGRSVETVLHDIQGRLGTPREVAEAAVFLASDRASFVNGAALTVDNTLTARLI